MMIIFINKILNLEKKEKELICTPNNITNGFAKYENEIYNNP